MIWILGAVAAVIVVVIALVAIGSVVNSLEQQDAPTVLLVEEAVAWIGDRLPDETAARLSYADVTSLVEWHLEWFTTQGLSSEYGEELASLDVVGERTDDLVAPVDESIDYVVARALDDDLAIEPVDAVVVVDLQHRYLRMIGAIDEFGRPA